MDGFAALGTNIIVEVNEPDKVSAGGIILPDSASPYEPYSYGTVLSVGDDVDLPVDVGDTIVFRTEATPTGGGTPIIIDQSNVAAVKERRSEERDFVYDEIDEERDYQDKKWGGRDNDARNTDEDWAGLITEYGQGTGRGEKYTFRERMVKVAALAVAAIEAGDCDCEAETV